MKRGRDSEYTWEEEGMRERKRQGRGKTNRSRRRVWLGGQFVFCCARGFFFKVADDDSREDDERNEFFER